MNFQKLGEVELLKEVPKNANLFVEYEGKVKRAPAKLGSGEGKVASIDILPLLMSLDSSSGTSMFECSLEDAYSYIDKVKESDAVCLYADIPEEMQQSMPLPISTIKLQLPIIIGGGSKDESSGEILMEGIAGIVLFGEQGAMFVVMASPTEDMGMIGIIGNFQR